MDELTDADPLPALLSRPSTFDRPMQNKIVEEEMSKSPLDFDPLPLDTYHPLRDDNDNDRSKSSTRPTLSDDSRRGKNDMNNDNLNDEDDDGIIVEYSLADAHSSLQLIVYLLFFSYPLRTLLPMIHDMTLIKTSLSLMPLTHQAGNFHC